MAFAGALERQLLRLLLTRRLLTHRTHPVQDDIMKAAAKGVHDVSKARVFKFDDDLPGGGQFYCVETGKHFISADALAKHRKSRFYKRRLQELKEEQYTQGVADLASGKTKEVLPPAHPELQKSRRSAAEESSMDQS